MKTTTQHHLLYPRRLRQAMHPVTLAAALFLGTAHPTSAQWSGERSYFFPGNSMKHFAITPVEGQDAYMTAGTIFSYKSSRFATPTNAIHWMYIDQNANVIYSKVINEELFDERPIGIHIYGDNAVIVASHRDETPVIGGSPQTAPAGVEIISVSKTTGNIGVRNLVKSTDPNYRNLYPLASLQVGDQLFVCGYATFNNNSTAPDLSAPKRSFVFKYDVANNTLVGIRFIESGFNPTAYDFDMATCIKRISSGIWMGGSTNVGSMMNRIIDPNTLLDNASTPAAGIGAAGQSNYESSYDIIETDNGDLFVFGNTINIDKGSTTTPLLPLNTHITAVQSNLVPYPGNSRWQFSVFDNPWGVNVLQEQSDRSMATINGFGDNRTCNQTPLTNSSNINPFLCGVKLAVNTTTGDIVVTPQFWNTMLSYNGTGTSTLSTSFYKLGNFMSSIMQPPVSAVRDYTVSSDIILTSPLWDNTNRLNFKLIRAKNNGEVPGCNWVPMCTNINGFTSPTTTGTPGINMAAAGVVTGLNNMIADYLPDHIDDCSGRYKNAPDDATGTTTATLPGKLCRVYPNPADKELMIDLPDGGTAHVRIFDLQGRIFSEQQLTGKRSLKLDVAAYPSGMYFYTISHNGTIQSGKLSIR